MDLLTVVPDCSEYLEPFSDILLFARGHKTTETRSQPLVWFSSEGYSAHFYVVTGDRKDAETRKLSGVSHDSSLVFFSFGDALADCFRRRYKMIVEGKLVWDAALLWHEYALLNLAARGTFDDQDDVRKACKRIRSGVEHACRRFGDIYHMMGRMSA